MKLIETRKTRCHWLLLITHVLTTYVWTNSKNINATFDKEHKRTINFCEKFLRDFRGIWAMDNLGYDTGEKGSVALQSIKPVQEKNVVNKRQ